MLEKVRYLNDGESTNPLTLGNIMSERAYAFLNYSLEQAEGRLKEIKPIGARSINSTKN